MLFLIHWIAERGSWLLDNINRVFLYISSTYISLKINRCYEFHRIGQMGNSHLAQAPSASRELFPISPSQEYTSIYSLKKTGPTWRKHSSTLLAFCYVHRSFCNFTIVDNEVKSASITKDITVSMSLELSDFQNPMALRKESLHHKTYWIW
jgi:hypothetical protein